MTEFVTQTAKIPHVADKQNDKETRYNEQCAYIDAFLTGKLALSVDDSNAYTLTEDQFMSANIFEFSDGAPAPTDFITITIPNLRRGLFVVRNLTSRTLDVVAPLQVTGSTALGSNETGHFFSYDD